MKTMTAALAAISTLLLAVPAGAQNLPAGRAATLSVVGEGTVTRAPDRAVVTFGIVTNDDAAARATSANNSAYNGLVAKLAALGVTGAAVRTTAYGVAFNPRPPNPSPQYQERYGYVVSRTVTATTDRTDGVGAIVDAGVAAGTTTIEGVSFGLRDNRAAARAAGAAAVADADAQAHALAEAAHLRIVRISSIASGGGAVPRPLPMARAVLAAAPASVPTDLPPGDLTFVSTVTVIYEVAP